ncbi:plastocyanin/azurin family copper-binding protein [Halobacterium noricense]|uniref:plastocyanin/azurin family copper-binding protein n=1 Tax=Halobacterium noricense TaxID=223182 RepID=UPI001E2D19DD|nr:plastocyanin/azurin family copper-binding protein [Halobacterium noricense]UHH26897.1 plastocyanin/azurin family copper-binding protein [Halobacterium noricense]UHH27115.1 plastocyanin/azurin family copper-binding protein [Halobacterium noricense]
MTDYSRRQFLGALGAGTVASAGFTQPVAAQETPVVKMGNNYFDPIGLHVEPGTTVRFEIAAGAHSATAYENRIPADGSAFDSGTISSGAFEYTFEAPGTYDYYCIPHKTVGMVGRIVVGSPGGPAEDSPIPDGEVPDSETIVQNGAVAVGSDVEGSGSTDGGMMGPGGGMMGGSRGGRGGVPFIGGALGMLGLIGGLLYWALGRSDESPESQDSAMDTLQRRYAQGEIDEEEFERRHDQLTSDR